MAEAAASGLTVKPEGNAHQAEFTADKAWGALDIANMSGITTRLHWTDQPYKWHVNDGEGFWTALDRLEAWL